MNLEDLIGRRVRIWLGVATRGEIRTGRDTNRSVEGVVRRDPVHSFVIDAPDGRVPYVIDKTRVLDVWGGSGNMIGSWVPVYDGRVPREPAEKKPVTTRCSSCGEVGHNRLKCKRRS